MKLKPTNTSRIALKNRNKPWRRSRSLFVRIVVPMVVFTFMLFFAFGLTIVLSGIVGEAERSAEAMLKEKSSESASSAGYFMNYKWSQTVDCSREISLTAQQMCADEEINLSELLFDNQRSTELLQRSFTSLLRLLRQSGTNEVFLILHNGDGGKHSCIYLCDLDPSVSAADNSDILMKVGSYEVASQNGISLDSGWSERITVDEFCDFYNLPIKNAENVDSMSAKEFGVWSEPSSLGDDLSTVKFSVPVVNESGDIIGVLGTGILQKTFGSVMSNTPLDGGDDFFYVLAKGDVLDGQMRVCWYFGTPFEEYYGNSTYISLGSSYRDNPNIVEAHPLYRKDSELVAAYTKLELADSKQDGDGFYFVAVSEKDAVYYSRGKMLAAFLLAMAAGLLLAVVCAYFISRVIARSALKAADHFKESNPKDTPETRGTGIAEIDFLVDSALKYALDSKTHGARYADIVRKAEISFGVFDFNLSTGMVFISANMRRLFGVGSGSEDITIGEQQFEDIFGLTRSKLERRAAHIRKIINEKNGQERWVRITVKSKDEHIVGAVSDITEEMSAKRLIEYERDHDSLTGLLSKHAFREMLYTKFSFPYDFKAAALLTVDLDDLKQINDTLGHDIGDEYIKAAAAVIKRYTNFSVGFSGMISGDEFQLFLAVGENGGAETKEQLYLVISGFQRELSEASITLANGQKLFVKASIGVAWYPSDSRNPDMLIKYSVFAKYNAKKNNRGGLLEFDKDSYDKEAVSSHIADELNRIIAQRAVTFVFQPIVEVKSGRVVGYEALLRPCSEIISTPLALLRAARSEAKLYEIEKLAFEKSFEHFAGMVREGVIDKGDKLFVNSVSNASLQPEEAEELFAKYPEIYENIVLEIRESDQIVDEYFLHKRRRVNEVWKGLVALDNFGTSYNNEFSLMRAEPDMAKIDISIVRNLHADKSRQNIFADLVSYCRKWDVLVAAVGVETKEDYEMAVELGAQYVQGLYVGRPSPIPGKVNIDDNDDDDNKDNPNGDSSKTAKD